MTQIFYFFEMSQKTIPLYQPTSPSVYFALKQPLSLILVTNPSSPRPCKTRLKRMTTQFSSHVQQSTTFSNGTTQETEIYTRVLALLTQVIQQKRNFEHLFREGSGKQDLRHNFVLFRKGSATSIETDAVDQEQEWLELEIKNKTSLEGHIEEDFNSQIVLKGEYGFDSEMALNIKIIEGLYDTPSPFVIIHSISLLLKYLRHSRGKLTEANVVKLLLIAIILAYKNAYDQQVQQINLYFAQILGINLDEANSLEMRFLREMEFQSFVSVELFLKVTDVLYS